MRKSKRGWVLLGSLAMLVIAVPAILWAGLSYQPDFYRDLTEKPSEQRLEKAEKFVAQSLRLRNDIVNEPRWEAVFTDEEVNAWLAEDLVTHFADQIPPGVHDPRVVFEDDRLTLAFRMEEGAFQSVVWVVIGVAVPKPNELALSIEKIRAGVLPVPAEQILDEISEFARTRGIDVVWTREQGLPVATIRYTPDTKRSDVILELVELRQGQIRLWGKSQRDRGQIATPALPTRKVLQSTFPKRNPQARELDVSGSSPSNRQRTATPEKRSPWSKTSTRSSVQSRAL